VTGLLVELPGLRCRVEAPDRVLAEICAYLAAAQHSVSPQSAAAHIIAEVDREAVRAAAATCAATADAPVVRSHPQLNYWHRDTRDGRVLLPVHGPRHAIRVSGSVPRLQIHVAALDLAALARQTKRVLRALVLRAVDAAGGGSVHGGAVRLAATGLLVGGLPGSGKTSVITALVETHGAGPISNDRTAVLADTHGRWTAHGVPLAWRYTPEGLAASPRLSAARRETRLRRGHDLVDGKIEFTLDEIGRHLGATPLPATPVTRIVILDRAGRHMPRPTGPRATARHLRLDPDPFAEDWLDLHARLDSRPTTGVPERLTRSVDTSILRWRDPTELASLARCLARRAMR
jgi:hypothetical protein